jgi:arylsulfatase A-like enzyme
MTVITSRVQMIRRAAADSAVVWAIYGIVETFFIVAGPLARQALVTFVPRLPAGDGPFVSAGLTALFMTLYLLFGAFLGAASAAVLMFLGTGNTLSKADSHTLWSSLGCLLLTILFGLNAWLTNQRDFVFAVAFPIALASLRLGSAWLPVWRKRLRGITHPLVIMLTLVGTAFIVQARAYIPTTTRWSLCVAYSAAVLLLATVASRLSSSADSRRGSGNRRMPSAWAALFLISCAAVASTLVTDKSVVPRGPQAARRSAGHGPNVILIVLDTVRADHLSLYGYRFDTTPNLKRLAATNATVYTGAISSANLTIPTHASIFTGQSPRRHGAHQMGSNPLLHPISPNSVTIAEVLSHQGYVTAGIAANFLSPAFGFDRGFAYYDCISPRDFFARTSRPYLLRESVRRTVAALISPVRREAAFSNAETVNKKAMNFLQSIVQEQQPFFLFLNYMDAHAPYVPPPPFDIRFPGKDQAFRWRRYQDIVDDVSMRHIRPISDRERHHLISQYDGGIAYLDDQLEKLFGNLRSLDLFDNSLIIVTADHGEAFGESSIIGHGRSLYQHQIHVPLIVKYPGALKAARVDTLVSSVDLLPTILDVVGAPTLANIEGTSLRRLNPLAPRRITSESYAPRGSGFTSNDARPAELALFSGSFKQILGAGGAVEIYDLSKDPNETTNLYGRVVLPKESAELLALMTEAKSQPLDGPVTDPEVLKRLRALGYLR